jgi:hypothetical protein
MTLIPYIIFILQLLKFDHADLLKNFQFMDYKVSSFRKKIKFKNFVKKWSNDPYIIMDTWNFLFYVQCSNTTYDKLAVMYM